MYKTPSSPFDSAPVNEDELASDFLEYVSLAEDNVYYEQAQVAEEPRAYMKRERTTCDLNYSKSATSKPEHKVSDKLKGKKCLEFSVKRPDDETEVSLMGIMCIADNVIVVDIENKIMKMFDHNGSYISSTKLKDSTWGITFVQGSTFATCGTLGNTIYLWTVHGKKIVREDKTFHVDHWSQGIHYNGTYFCVLHRDDDAITILDRQGRQDGKIILHFADRRKFSFGWDVHMDKGTNNIYVPCCDENGVLCLTIDGQFLWFISLPGSPRGITESHGKLCVADYYSTCLHLVGKEGDNVRKFLDEKDLEMWPQYVCYAPNGRLYVCFIDERSDSIEHISVYKKI